ncbi:Putative peptidoglycan binding domain protein [Rhodobacterales bacterium Y4I]|nr:Putative peptidoglycan binding domain protein [Rhodobacterales bacterium Y4I]
MVLDLIHPISFLDTGEHVAALQEALGVEGFTVDAEELQHAAFGRSTQTALRELQERVGLTPSGNVDAATARAISERLDRRGLLQESRAVLRDLRSLREGIALEDMPSEARAAFTRIADAEVARLVLEQIPDATDEARDVIGEMRLSFEAVRDQPLEELLRETVLPQLADHSGVAALAYKAAARLKRLDARTVGDRTGLTGDIRRMPGLGRLARRTRAAALTQLAGLEAPEQEALEEVDFATVGRFELMRAARAAGVDEARTARLAELADFTRILDDDFEAVDALRDEGINTARDLAARNATDWAEFLRRRELTPPDGMDVARFARVIDLNVQTTFPSSYALARLSADPDQAILDHLEAFERIPAPESGRLSGTPDLSQMSPPEAQRAAAAALAALRPFAWQYRRLGFVALLDDPEGTADDWRRDIRTRIASLRRFHQSNPDYDLQRANLGREEGRIAQALRPNFTEVPEDQRADVQRFLGALQRVYAMASTYDEAVGLMRADYDTAARIRATPRDRLVEDLVLPEAAVDRIRSRAATLSIRRDHLIATFADFDLQPFALSLDLEAADPVIPAALNELRRLDSYASLFGNQNFCDCAHCRSIYSPAAYFVDLMRFIDREITTPNFVSIGEPNHPLALRRRRPDLWSLPLTCENTDTRIPYLVIVNEVLSRVLTETFDIEEGDTDAAMAALSETYLQPINLAFAELELYLDRFGLGFAELAAPLNLTDETRSRLTLGLSPEFFAALFTPAPNDAPGRFGFIGPLNDFSVADLMRRTKISRGMLDRLLELPAVVGGLSVAIDHGADGAELLQLDLSAVPAAEEGPLTRQMFDRLHRIARLAESVDWPPEALDHLLANELEEADADTATPAAHAAALEAASGSALAQAVADLQVLSQRLALKLPEALALVATPPAALEPDGLDVLAALMAGAESLDIRHPELETPAPVDDSAIGAGFTTLRRALRMGEPDLLALIQGVLSPAEIATGEIDVDQAVRLYRVGLVARGLRLPVAQVLQMAALGGIDLQAATMAARAAAGLAIADLADDIAATRLDLPAYAWALDPAAERPKGLGPEPEQTLAAARARLLAARAPGFDVAALAADVGLQMAEAAALSRQLDVATPAAERTAPWLIAEPGADQQRYRLGPEAALPLDGPTLFEALTAAGILADDAQAAADLALDIAAFLQAHDTLTLLTDDVAAVLGIDRSLIDALAPLIAQGIDTDFRTLVDDWVSGAVALPAPVQAWFTALQRHAYVLTTLGVDRLGLARLAAEPQLFEAAEPLAYDRAVLRNLALYAGYVRRGAATAAAIDQVLGAWGPQGLAGADAAALEVLIGENSGKVLSILPDLDLPAPPLEALEAADKAATLFRRTGLDAHALPALAATDYDLLRSVAQQVRTAIEDSQQGAADDGALFDDIDDRLHGLRRDGLVDWILGREAIFQFRTPAELYSYFLLDVETDGCSRTSRVLEAGLAGQLYIRRCLMSLEQSQDGDIAVALSEEAQEQIEWRLRYRTFEAARRIYVYPENYLDEDLRDNRSHLFIEAQQALAQGDLSTSAIETVVRDFLKGFCDVGRLSTIAAHFDNDTNTYTFIGRTPNSPSRTYMREWRNRSAWTPWAPLNIDVTAPKVTLAKQRGILHMAWTNARTPENQDWLVETQGIDGQDSVQDLLDAQAEGDEDAVAVPIRGTPVVVEYSFLTPSGRWEKPQVAPFYVFPSKASKINISTIRYSDKVYIDGTYPDSIGKLRLSHPIFWHQVVVSGTKQIFGYLDKYTGRITDRDGFPVVLPTGGPPPQPVVSGRYQTSGLRLWTRIFQSEAGVWVAGDELALIRQHNAIYYNSEATAEQGLRLSAAEDSVTRVANLPDRAKVDHIVVHNLTTSSIFSLSDRQFLIRKTGRTGAAQNPGTIWEAIAAFANTRRQMIPLSTSVVEDLGEILFEQGLEAFYSIETQKLSEETPNDLGMSFEWIGELAPPVYGGNILREPSRLEFDGSYGVYFWEIFYHLPRMIAQHLTANGKFEEADRWLRRIWNPFHQEPDGQVRSRAKWRFLPFQDLDEPRVLEMLRDEAALESYRRDPFNPFAIARQRPSAFRKAVVMQSLNNMLDWADDRFARDTQESLNEALMLYVTVQQLLGERPVETGDCEGLDDVVSYSVIALRGDEDSEFLIELETFIAYAYFVDWGVIPEPEGPDFVAPGLGIAQPAASDDDDAPGIALAAIARTADAALQPFEDMAMAEIRLRQAPAGLTPARSPLRSVARAAVFTAETPDPGEAVALDFDFAAREVLVEPDPGPVPFAGAFNYQAADPGVAPEPETQFAFCLPPNPDLLAIWDRLEDRLFKLRNCLNINGVRRELPLFDPPIDPRLLVRARAAGLDLDAINDLLQDDVPVHRFEVLLQSARTYASTVEALGAKLLQAFERKDALALEELQTGFQRELSEVTARVHREARKEAEATHASIAAAVAGAEGRRDYYDELLTSAVDTELAANENEILYIGHIAASSLAGREAAEADRQSAETQSQPSWNASVNLGAGFNFSPVGGGLFTVVASAGYGSANLAARSSADAAGKRKDAVTADAAAASTSARAGYQRRKVEWEHMRAQAEHEITQLGRQLDAAKLRELVIDREAEVTRTQGEQAGRLLDFYRDRFTDTGLQTYLATELGRLHRSAYARARDMALEAQRAYRFETGDDTFFITGDSWDPNRAGLLSGEALTLRLHDMEASYLSRARRRQEIMLSCPLSQIDPAALLALQSTGQAAFRIPESWFDLTYPGQFRRRIRSVRVTIPCVVGPYTPVAAKLTLTGSRMRMAPSLEPEASRFLARPRNQSITTSTAKSDAGLLTFAYEGPETLPFEGAGAADSDWRIELPSELRVFDYSTITDVILTVAYDAEEDGVFRGTVEASLRARLIAAAQDTPLSRIFSLRREFPDLLHQLTSGSEGAPATGRLRIGREHFPYWMREEELGLTSLRVYAVQPSGAEGPPAASLEIAGQPAGAWVLDQATGLFAADIDLLGMTLGDETLSLEVSLSAVEPVSDYVMRLRYGLN